MYRKKLIKNHCNINLSDLCCGDFYLNYNPPVLRGLTAIPFIGRWGIWLTTGMIWTVTAVFALFRYKHGAWKEISIKKRRYRKLDAIWESVGVEK